jgi:ribonuclease P protein component
VAYAISRAVGTAVVRNRLRRRLRALVATRGELLPPGTYLIGAAPGAAARSSSELRFDLDALITRVRAPGSPPRSAD